MTAKEASDLTDYYHSEEATKARSKEHLEAIFRTIRWHADRGERQLTTFITMNEISALVVLGYTVAIKQGQPFPHEISW